MHILVIFLSNYHISSPLNFLYYFSVEFRLVNGSESVPAANEAYRSRTVNV